MKSYRITEDIKLSPCGNVLQLDIGNNSFDLDDDTVANALNILIGLVFSPKNTFVKESCSRSYADDRSIELTFRHPVENDFELEFVSRRGLRVTNVITIADRSVIVKLTNVLTVLLPRICEEGV